MSQRFKTGEMIKMLGSSPVKIIKWLAEGGQGDVYVVEQEGEQKALKWYKPNGMGKDPNAFYDNLAKNCRRGAPDPKVFLWPEDITEWKEDEFGYIMPLRPDGYYEMGDFLLTKIRFSSMKVVVDASLNIVNAYRILHNEGYSYQDLNDGNFFINPRNGAVLICDNDNVAPDNRYTGIAGKPGYMAPEIMLQKNMPNSYSDRASMSIIIFMLFCLTRPLEGKRMFGDMPRTDEFMEKVYGSDPHFIMENINHPEYGPDKNVQKNVFIFWNALPKYMQDFFLKAFSQKAMENPGARPTELDWLQHLVRFRSEIVKCQCGADIFIEDAQSTICSRCKRMIKIPYRLSLVGGKYKIPALPDSRIYRCQVGTCNADEALKPVGRVLANNSNPSLLGIRNLTEKYWNAETPSGVAKKVMSKDVVPLKDNIKLLIESEKIIIEKN